MGNLLIGDKMYDCIELGKYIGGTLLLTVEDFNGNNISKETFTGAIPT